MAFKTIKFILRQLTILFLIYAVWSIAVDMSGLDHRIDDESLVPCLFYLPPIGIFAAFFVIIRLVTFTFIRIRLFKNKKKD